VLYWLGVGDALTTNVLNQVEPVTQELERCANDSVELWKSSSWERFNLPPRDGDFWQGMRDLLTNKWWDRLWTLQEGRQSFFVVL
jgi:hypothetical protein